MRARASVNFLLPVLLGAVTNLVVAWTLGNTPLPNQQRGVAWAYHVIASNEYNTISLNLTMIGASRTLDLLAAREEIGHRTYLSNLTPQEVSRLETARAELYRLRASHITARDTIRYDDLEIDSRGTIGFPRWVCSLPLLTGRYGEQAWYVMGWPFRSVAGGVDAYSPQSTMWLLQFGQAGGVHDIQIPLRPLWLGFVLNSAIYAAAWSGAIVLLKTRMFARRRRLSRGLCPACGYDLRGSTACPECGRGMPTGDTPPAAAQ